MIGKANENLAAAELEHAVAPGNRTCAPPSRVRAGIRLGHGNCRAASAGDDRRNDVVDGLAMPVRREHLHRGPLLQWKHRKRGASADDQFRNGKLKKEWQPL